jgi:hypothetical protein
MYTNQSKKARQLIVSELGADKVSLMSDKDVMKYLQENYVLLSDQTTYDIKDDFLYCIPKKLWNEYKDKATILQR